MQAINVKSSDTNTGNNLTNNTKSNPVKVVNVDKKIPFKSAIQPSALENKIFDKGCTIIQGYLGEGKEVVYCCIGNVDNDQENYEATLKKQIQQVEQARDLASE